MKKLSLVILFFFGSLSFGWAGKCPPGDQVLAAFKRVFPQAQKFKVKEVKPSPVEGLCEVILETGPKRYLPVYVDKTAHYAFVGQLLDLRKGKNISRAHLSKLSRLSPQEIKKLEKLVAFTVGNGSKSFYLVTDPDCPFCKRLEKTLDDLLKDEKIKVQVILFPLERLHPQAKKKCIAIICDQKGWPGLTKGYISDHQCKEGIKKVEEAQKILPLLGIRGTPAIILPDGRLIFGAQPKERLEKLLGI